MAKLSRIVLVVAIYVASAAMSWLGIGRWLWDGSDRSQVLTPASMTCLTVALAEAGLLGIGHVSRYNQLASTLAAALAVLLAAGLLTFLHG